jgi:AcrR family transcriptional regulator
MPRTRSRPKTEAKFQDAVLELVARDGCGNLGINSVAQKAGSDKVLIYRYFGDFKGLLSTIAKSRQWLPSCEEIWNTLPAGEISALTILETIKKTLCDHINQDACTPQLLRWRRVGVCPLCQQFTHEWENLWQTLPNRLTRGLSSEQRTAWRQANTLLSLLIEAEFSNEAIDRQCLQHIANGLEKLTVANDSSSDSSDSFSNSFASEETLPTNLL